MTENSIDDNDRMDRDDALRFLGAPGKPVKSGTLNAWISRGQIPHYRYAGRTVMFSRKELQKWIEERKVPAVGGLPRPARRRRVAT